MNNELELAIKDFVRNGGVVLAANDSRNIVDIRGTFEEVSEKFIKALVNMSVTIIKKNPKAFEVMAAATMSHLLALAEIAEKNYDAPQLRKDVIYCLAMTLCDKDAARYAALSTKHMLEEMEDEA